MTDFFIKSVPLPIPRPSGTIDARIALERAEKATGEFNWGEWYTPSGESTNLLYGLLNQSSAISLLLGGLAIFIIYKFMKWKKYYGGI